jgi:hypothetical protein
LIKNVGGIVYSEQQLMTKNSFIFVIPTPHVINDAKAIKPFS